MKKAVTVSVLLYTVLILVLLIGCECSKLSIKNKIEFNAVYNKEKNCIDAEIINNTGDMAISYIKNYTVQKKVNVLWDDIIEDKGLSLWPASSWIYPYDGHNTGKEEFPAYNKDNPDTALKSGTYKLIMNVSVYDSSQFGTLSSDAFEENGEMRIKANASSTYIALETEFTVS